MFLKEVPNLMNRFKDIVRRGISLALAMVMIIPTGVYAGNHSVSNWDEYREKLISDIMKQEKTITINFNGNEIFSTEYYARLKITDAYEKAIEEIPQYLGGSNIISVTTIPELEGVENAELNKVIHTIEYKYDTGVFSDIRNILARSGIYDDIGEKSTDYEKIKTAYDYIVEELDKTGGELYELLTPPKDAGYTTYPYTVLFTLIMTDLGYDNDIAISNNDHEWNLIKVHSKWYHVDGSQEVIVDGEVGEEYFLLGEDAIKDSDWNSDDHKDKNLATEKYNGNPPEVPQIKYEIALIEQELNQLKVIEAPDEITLEAVRGLKDSYQILEARLGNFEERIELLKAEVDRLKAEVGDQTVFNEVIGELNDLKSRISDKSKEIGSRKETIVNKAIGQAQRSLELNDIEVAIEASDMFENNPNKEKMIALQDAVIAIEIAERARLESDIKLAEEEIKNEKISDLKEKLQERIKVLEATIAVEKAETTFAEEDIVKAEESIEILNESIIDKETIESLKDRVKVVKAIKSANETEQAFIKKAEAAVKKAENSIRNNEEFIESIDEKIKEAERVVTFVKTPAVVSQLTERIQDVIIAKDAIALVNEAKEYLKTIPASELLSSTAETKIRAAEDQIKNIKTKDRDVRTAQQDRIKAIKVVVTALKAVEKAETLPLKTSNVNSAQRAIDKIDIVKYEDIIISLNNRLEKELADKEAAANTAVANAELSLKTEKSPIADNQRLVDLANDAVNNLPTSNVKKDHQTTIKDLNNAIKAKEAVENAEAKGKNLTQRDITTVEKAIDSVINKLYIPGLSSRLDALKANLNAKETTELITNAVQAVEKAESTRVTKDITAAKKAINLLSDNELDEDGNKIKEGLIGRIEDLEVEIAEEAMSNAEITKVSKDINAAKKAIDAISNKIRHSSVVTYLNNRVAAMNNYLDAIKVLVSAEKNMTAQNKLAAENSLNSFKNAVSLVTSSEVESVSENVYERYEEMIADINFRVGKIGEHLQGEENKVNDAIKAIENAEENTKVDTNPTNGQIQAAQSAINLVTDKKIRTDLQKRLDAIQQVMEAKTAVLRAESYPNDKSVKDAESALSKVDGRYAEIIQSLSEIIAGLRNNLDIQSKVAEASKLVQKAADSRNISDISNARFAVNNIKDLASESYAMLDKMLEDLLDSIANEEGTATEALAAAQEAIGKAFAKIDETNAFVIGIIEGEEEEVEKIQEAYRKIEFAKLEIIKANAAVRKLSDQKGLLAEIAYANQEIDLAEDNVDVKEAVRLVTIASSSVLNVNDEVGKSKARLDISAARRAIDRINHNNNRSIRTTILNTINAIDSKLESDNDQELIDIAIDEVNQAAELLAKAVREGSVMEDQEQIEKTIFSAKMAIGWISDNNKTAKSTLTGFLNDIEAMFKAEKDGILNGERIENAEKAVEEAESKKDSEDLESYIRSARLRIRLIRNDGPDTALKIDELNARLDALEGNSGSSGNSGNQGNSGNSGSSGSGGKNSSGQNSSINPVPTTPLSDRRRNTGSTEPHWGKTKELKSAVPVIGYPNQNIAAYRINDSKQKIVQLSNSLTSSQSANVQLMVRGKLVDAGSGSYILDRVNNSILLPAKTLGDELGFTVNFMDNTALYGSRRLMINGFADGYSKSISMDIGSQYAYINGYASLLSSSPVLDQGRAYLPMDFLVEHLGLSFNYSNQNGITQLIIN